MTVTSLCPGEAVTVTVTAVSHSPRPPGAAAFKLAARRATGMRVRCGRLAQGRLTVTRARRDSVRVVTVTVTGGPVTVAAAASPGNWARRGPGCFYCPSPAGGGGCR